MAMSNTLSYIGGYQKRSYWNREIREISPMNDTLPTCDCSKCRAVIELLTARVKELETLIASNGNSMVIHRRLLLDKLKELDKLAS